MQPTSDPKDIGFPISSNLWVVDPNNRHRRLPIGCTGELLIEGHIAARGYLGDEEKTAQAFVTDVSWATRPFRGYLTGDLVVQRPDGGFTIVGRKDNQVVCEQVLRMELADSDRRNTMGRGSSSWRLSIT
jgi:non-ribosomal peptide synthetase component F